MVIRSFAASLLFVSVLAHPLTVLAQPELPKPSPENTFYVLPWYSGFGGGSDATAQQEADRIKGLLGDRLYARVGFSLPVNIALASWNIDVNDPAAVQANLASTFAAIDRAVARAAAMGIAVAVNPQTATRPFFWTDRAHIDSHLEDRRNVQWHADNSAATVTTLSGEAGWWTFSRYARKQRAFLEAHVRAVGAHLAAKVRQYPSTLVAAGGDGEAELSFLKSAIQSGYTGPLQLADYSPFTVLEFRDWVRHTGMYDERHGEYQGQGYSGQPWNYAGDLTPATDDNRDGHTFNGDFGQSFVTWDLAYFDWSLADSVTADPQAISHAVASSGWSAIPQGGPQYVSGGFDAPRVYDANSRFWQLWDAFRVAMIRNYCRDFAEWITTSPDSTGATFPTARWYSYGIPADYLFGSHPSIPNLRLITGASPIHAADIAPFGGIGITSFNPYDNGTIASTSAAAFPIVKSLADRWAIWEYNPSVPTSQDAYPYQADMPLIKRYRPSVIGPYMWRDTERYYGVEDTPFIAALASVMADLGDIPHPATDTSGYKPPTPGGLSAVLEGTSARVQWSGLMWAGEPLSGWRAWRPFSHFELHRASVASFTPTALTLVRTSTSTSLTDALPSPGLTCYRVVAVSKAGLASAASAASCVTWDVPPGPPVVTVSTPAPDGSSSFTATSPFLSLSGRAFDSQGIQSITWTSNRGGSGTITATATMSRVQATGSGTVEWRIDGIKLEKGENVITLVVTDIDGHVTTSTVTATLNSVVYYLAEGATGLFDLDIAIANPNAAAVPYTITFLKEDGTTATESRTIAPTSRTTIPVNQIDGMSSLAVSTVVDSPTAQPLVVERTMFWDAQRYGGHGEIATNGARTKFFFAEGSQGYFDTWLLLANPSSRGATVMVTFLLDPSGTVTKTYGVPANARLTIFAGSIPALVGRSFGMVVSSDLPVIAERAMYFGTGRFWEGGHESAGVAEPATSWFHAEGATGAFFDTYILVANPSPVDAAVTMTYLLGNGTSFSVPYKIATGGRLTVNLEDDPRLRHVSEVSTTVSSNVPVVSERAMYWPGGAATWAEAHNSFGLTQTAVKWGLAEGRAGGPEAFATYILLANPSATAAQVQIAFLRTNGAPVVKTFRVGPTSRFTVDVSGMVGELVNESFGAVVESTNGVPIAVERALYWNAVGQTWAGGTNAAATPLP